MDGVPAITIITTLVAATKIEVIYIANHVNYFMTCYISFVR